MEHVAFFIEESGVLIRCLLNPETLVVRRLAGVRTRQPTGGRQAGAGALDDLIFFTGGGRTELELDLLFDVDLPGSSPPAQNVRDLTGPIWQLAENSTQAQGTARPPHVRFLWGKAWNIPGVVLAIAERFESFTPAGVARRSWLRMRFLRVSDAPRPGTGAQAVPAPPLPQGENSLAMQGEPSHIYQPLTLGEPAVEQPPAGPPGLVDPNDLLAQALQDNPTAQQALQEAGQAIGALAKVAKNPDLPPEAASELNKAVQEMRVATQSVIPGEPAPAPSPEPAPAPSPEPAPAPSPEPAPAPPPEPAPTPAVAAVRIAAAQAAASEALAGLPGGQTAIEEAKDALNRLSPVLEKLGPALAQMAEDAQKSAADLTASAAAQISTLAEQSAEKVSGLPAAFEEMAVAAKQICAQGIVSGAEDVLKRLDGLGPQLTTAWTENNARLARHAMQAMALAGHNIRAAEAVFQAVSPGALLAKGLTDLRACLQSFETGKAGAQAALLDAVRRLEATARVVLDPAAPGSASPGGHPESEAILGVAVQVRQALRLMENAETGQAGVEGMQTALGQLETLVKDCQAAEAARAAEQVRSAVAQPSGEVTAPPAEWKTSTERLDQIAFRYYGSPAYWRLLAQANQIDNPLDLAPNQPLVIPPDPRAQVR